MDSSASFLLSSGECVLALCSLGFVVAERWLGRTVLMSGASFVVVPDRLEMPEEVLERVLLDANVTRGALLDAVAGLPTEPEPSVPSG
jgi:hypothetical protein